MIRLESDRKRAAMRFIGATNFICQYLPVKVCVYARARVCVVQCLIQLENIHMIAY